MNSEVEEHRIVTIIRSVAAEHEVDAHFIYDDPAEGAMLSLRIEYWRQRRRRIRREAANMALGVAGGSMLGDLGLSLMNEVGIERLVISSVLLILAMWCWSSVRVERPIEYPALRDLTHARLRQHGYEIIDDPGVPLVVSWRNKDR